MDRKLLTPRLVVFLVATALAGAVLWNTRGSLTPFAIGLVLAYLLAPVVNRLHRAMPSGMRRRRLARPAAILITYFAAAGMVVALGAVVIPPLFHQAQELIGQAPELSSQAIARVNVLVDRYYTKASPAVRQAVDAVLGSSAATRLTSGAVDAVRRVALGGFGAVTSTVSWLIGLLLVPVWLVYVLGDTKHVVSGLVGLVPSDLRADIEAIRIVVDRVLSAYVRGQLVVAILLACMLTFALAVLNVPYFLLLGFLAGVLALIPFLGSILGAVPAVAVAAADSLQLAALVVLAFVLVQQIDNLFISPRVQARAVRLNPALIMVVLVIGNALMGPIGMLVAVPITAILRDVLHYIYVRVGEERPSPLESLTEVGYGAHATPLLLGAAPEVVPPGLSEPAETGS